MNINCFNDFLLFQYVDWWQNGRQLSINSNTSHVSSATYESTQSSVESLQQHFSKQMQFKTQQGSRAKKETTKAAQRKVRTPRPNSPRCQSRQPELDIKDQILIGSLETLNDIVLENILSKVNLEAIMFIDLDNIGKFFELLPKHLPETLYIVGFNGGDKNWKALHSVALQHHVQNGLFALVRCGTDKDAADKDLVTLAERIDSRIPQSITFFILSGDGGFFNFIHTANRHVQIQNPHKTLVKENLYHVILNHMTPY
ncbi:E3 SUMO-protein ligase ZNF451-like isoform X2 [Ruditapes philippinarum]|uniref:E3 SUMO-protein ligase ZNF451-like isoform X2 n=1 Tax=Ruditapes philippinarum TaxID=129788 RepID=UPI00295BE125|nr:E3 SUMO-protein ligase ZNF451-like isoform X2 [Ruditapes philippinarum]